MAQSAGIRITQAGVDARFAADYQYVFNSDWPSLAIAFETLISAPTNNVTIPHNLGFVPFVQAWFINNGINVGRAQIGGSSAEFSYLTFDKQNVYINVSSFFVPNNFTHVCIKCYNLDITKQIDYTLPQFPTQPQAYDPSTGIRVVKYDKSIGSNDLRDFILHSRAQSPAVLSIVTTPLSSSPGIPGYTNPTDYMPWVFGFGLSQITQGLYFPVASGPAQSGYELVILPKSAVKPNLFGGYQIALFSFSPTPNGVGSLVVLRDPLVLANKVNIVYGS